MSPTIIYAEAYIIFWYIMIVLSPSPLLLDNISGRKKPQPNRTDNIINMFDRNQSRIWNNDTPPHHTSHFSLAWGSRIEWKCGISAYTRLRWFIRL